MKKVVVLGLGSRGHIYGSFFAKEENAQIVAICDLYKEKIDNVKDKWKVPSNMCFTNENDLWALGKMGDIMVIASQDRDHYNHAIKAINLGYNLLIEKPLSPKLEECLEIERLSKEKGVKVIVCHVLRYTSLFRQIKNIIDSGVLGELRVIRHSENVSYWHFSHSYIRGNWRNENETSPLLLAKCCHDMDLLYWYVGAKAKKISSFGSLDYFKKENAPKGATLRCLECPNKLTCNFEAELQYLGRRNGLRRKAPAFKYGTYAFSIKGTKEDIREKLKTGNYGRCVFHCDNNVVDNQTVSIEFENDVRCIFTVNAFNQNNYRHIHINGTKGELIANDKKITIVLREFGKKAKKLRFSIIKDIAGHGGGDKGIVKGVLAILNGIKLEGVTDISETIESHKMVFAAEESRHNGGKLVELN